MRALAQVASALATAVCACSLVVGTDGLTGGAGSELPIDAAGLDAAVIDATGDASKTTWCGQQTGFAFCEDFDTPDASLSARWDQVFSNSGSIAIDGVNPFSPPGALLTIVPNPGTRNDEQLSKAFPSHGSTRVALDLLLEASDSSGYGSVAEIHLDPLPAGFTEYRVALINDSGMMTLNAYTGGSVAGETSMPLQRSFGAWRRVQLELALVPTPRAVAYDEAGSVIVSLPMPATVASAGTRVGVGLPYLTNATKPWRVRIDDVVVSLAN